METYSKNHEALQAQIQRQQEEVFAEKNWLEFLILHPELRFGGLANKNILVSYFGTDYPSNFTVAALEESFQNNPNLRSQLVIDDVEATGDRAKLLAELKEVFHGPQENWANELLAIKYQPNDQIRSKIEMLRSKHAQQGLSTDELRQVIRDGRPAPVVPELPASYTRKVIMSLSGRDLKSLMSRYGGDQVTNRINGILVGNRQ